MVKYVCNMCNFESADKSNYDRHLKTKKHINKDKEYRDKNRRQFNCPSCECNYLTQAGINRHLKSCANALIANQEKQHTTELKGMEMEIMKKDYQIELMTKDIQKLQEVLKIKDESSKKLEEVLKIKDESNKKLEDFLDNENEYHKKLVDNAGTVVKSSMSALKFARQNYPDAPVLVKYNNMDAIKLDKEYGVGATMIWHDENSTIAEAIGGIILKEFKKEDPRFQSLWNSDFARVAYIIMDDVNNKKQWVVDKGGVRVQELLVDPILFHIRGKLIKRSVRKAKGLAEDFHNPEKYINQMNQCNILIKKIDNKTIASKIMKYLSKFLHIGNHMATIEG